MTIMEAGFLRAPLTFKMSQASTRLGKLKFVKVPHDRAEMKNYPGVVSHRKGAPNPNLNETSSVFFFCCCFFFFLFPEIFFEWQIRILFSILLLSSADVFYYYFFKI